MTESSTTDLFGLDSSRMHAILLTLEEGIQLWDADGRLVYVNPASCLQLGDDANFGMGCHWTAFVRRCATEAGEPCDEGCFPIGEALAGIAIPASLLLQIGRGAGVIWLRVNARPLTDARAPSSVRSVPPWMSAN